MSRLPYDNPAPLRAAAAILLALVLPGCSEDLSYLVAGGAGGLLVVVSDDGAVPVTLDADLVFHARRQDNTDLWLLQSSTGKQQRLTQDPGRDVDPAYSPDG